MSHYEALMQRVKAAAFDLGVPEMAKRAGMDERTLRRILKKPTQQIDNLKRLEDVAIALKGEEA